ncbi:hypothetical protein [Aegicerativicinus sediminis]|uniref:hypothetical protein n=1 Tax=Aegicerativicinus sediminis TaxID=2893202 RepID=UPI001E39E625|nr:hypothetical protein [Aegicerativicinus sediminis]
MIDYIHMSTDKFDYFRILHDTGLKFTWKTNSITGEPIPNKHGTLVREASLKNLKIILKETNNGKKILIIQGSLHKYKNNGKHNKDDFNFEQFLDIILEVTKRLQIRPNDIEIKSIEIGFNIICPLLISSILKGLLYHTPSPFKFIAIKESEYYQAFHKQYCLKAYHKNLHDPFYYPVDYQIFRFELKVNKMIFLLKHLRNHSVLISRQLTLNQLLDKNLFEILGKLVIEKWSEIIMFDPTIDILKFSQKDQLKLVKFQNPNYWYEIDKYQRKANKKFLYKTIENNSERIQDQLRALMNLKLKELTTGNKPPNNHVKTPANIYNQLSIFD